MKTFHKFLALAALTPFLAACTPSNEDVCNHVMDIMKKEMTAAAGADAKAPTDEEMKKATADCVANFEKEKEKKGADVFNKQVKCVMAASDMEGMMKCSEEEKKAE